MSIFVRTCSAEWTRMRTVRTTWWFLAAAALVLLGLGTLLGFEAAADPPEVQGGLAWTTVGYIMMPAQFALLGLVLLSVTADYATGGIVPSLQWTPRRGVLFAARVLVPVAVATLVGLVLSVGSAVAINATAGSALSLRVADGVPLVGTVAFVLLAGTALAAGLGFALRSTAGGLISVFLLVVVLPLLLPAFGDWMQAVADVLPGAGVIHLLTEGTPTMTTTSSVTVLTLWAVGALALGWGRFARTDANAG